MALCREKQQCDLLTEELLEVLLLQEAILKEKTKQNKTKQTNKKTAAKNLNKHGCCSSPYQVPSILNNMPTRHLLCDLGHTYIFYILF